MLLSASKEKVVGKQRQGGLGTGMSHPSKNHQKQTG